MHQECPHCHVPVGPDMTNKEFEGLGHVCNPDNPHIIKQAGELGVDPVIYVALICGVFSVLER